MRYVYLTTEIIEIFAISYVSHPNVFTHIESVFEEQKRSELTLYDILKVFHG